VVSIHCELSGDRQRIVLVAAGEYAEDIALAAKRLQTLTPLFEKSDPPGALITPATWPAVVQLEATFGPALVKGPALQAWIRAQAEQRVLAMGNPLAYQPPAGLAPYSWQVAGAAMIAATGGALITDEPGTGKTITAILGLVERGRDTGFACSSTVGESPALVVCPASVIDAWVEAWRSWAPLVRGVAWLGP
jgi:hypothetical protein